MIDRLAIAGYRSLRDLRLDLSALNVVTGPNGSGKSSLYRALRLIADIAQGRIIQSLAREGGLPSTLWAGPATIARAVKQGRYPVEGVAPKSPVSLKLGFSGDGHGYAIDLGLPHPDRSDSAPPSQFRLDPEIKTETVWTGRTLGRANALAARVGPHARIRDDAGAWRASPQNLATFDSMMTHCADPRDALDLLLLRERMRAWRFYDSPRTDHDAPARRPQVGTYTPILAGDGADLAAALQTIREIGAADELNASIEDAFPGSSISVVNSDGYFEVEMHQHSLLRPLRAAELSDGTMRYLLLVAALLSPRPSEFLALNEPEASLHPDLLAPLARLIGKAARRSQIVVVTHAPRLVTELARATGVRMIAMEKEFGETIVQGGERPNWVWPSR